LDRLVHIHRLFSTSPIPCMPQLGADNWMLRKHCITHLPRDLCSTFELEFF
jgi:hypothetical protein